MGKVLNFGLIGCGRIAPRHAQSIRELSEARLVAVADIVESRAQRFAREYDAESCLDYRRVLDRRDVDVVNTWVQMRSSQADGASGPRTG